MDNSILVALITVSGSIVVAALSFFMTKYYERKVDWQKRKIEHYGILLSALSGIAIDNNDLEAKLRTAQAFNTICLVAPQVVIESMQSMWECTRINVSREEHNAILSRLMLAIRKDIGVRPKDDVTTFAFEFLGGPSAVERNQRQPLDKQDV